MDSFHPAEREHGLQAWPVVVRLILLGIATVLAITAAHLAFPLAFGVPWPRHTWSTGAKPADV